MGSGQHSSVEHTRSSYFCNCSTRRTMPLLYTDAHRTPGQALRSTQLLRCSPDTTPRASRMRARAAAQPSPEELAKMQEAMGSAMKDPQACH